MHKNRSRQSPSPQHQSAHSSYFNSDNKRAAGSIRITRQSPSPESTYRRSFSAERVDDHQYRNDRSKQTHYASAYSRSASPVHIEQKSNTSPSLLKHGRSSSQNSRERRSSINNHHNSDKASSSTMTIESIKSSNDLPVQKSPYNIMMHSVRRIMPEEMACSLGCKGAKCKYDNANWPDKDMVIDGLFSNWVTDDILAMARPRDKLIKESNLVQRMKKAGIRSIINLQSRGEHKDCGDGILLHTGFSYDPNDFCREEMFYYNFEMNDYGTVPDNKLIDMVRVLDFALSEGKVAIHCHAGLGRTGLLIACYLIYALRMNFNQAIYYIRDKRRGAVQMKEQIECTKLFEKYLEPLRVIFPLSAFRFLVKYQSYYEASADNESHSSSSSGSSSMNNNSSLAGNTFKTGFSLHTFLQRQRLLLHGHERKTLKYVPKILYACGEGLIKLANKWSSDAADPYRLKQIEKITSQLEKDLYELTHDNGHGKRYETYSDDLNQINPKSLIAKALSTTVFPKKTIRKVEELQKLLNESNDGYIAIETEEDPYILTALIWSWIDHLKEPILRDQEINLLLKRLYDDNATQKSLAKYDKRKIDWDKLDNNTFYTIRYLASVIRSLLPLDNKLEAKLFTQLINCLTHSKVHEQKKIFHEFKNGFLENSDHISLLNTTKSMKKARHELLVRVIRDMIDDDSSHSTSSSSTYSRSYSNSTNANKSSKNVSRRLYDYETEIRDDYDDEYNLSRRTTNKTTFY